ncbi:ATP-binding protein [Nocardia sp. NPDC050712]|uniref:ATP-binding protein n=1 Tax=Nocardia sp. NPDC050712 TaxID=3155518 RepID=UPI0033CB242E
MTMPAWPVSGGNEQVLEFDLDTTSDRWIRDTVRDLLAPDTDVVVVDDAVLSVDEMVVNAREHGRSPWRCRLRLLADPARLRVEVDDSSTEDPFVRVPDAAGGRGMLLLERIAIEWGVIHYARFKTVWAEVPLDRPRFPTAD